MLKKRKTITLSKKNLHLSYTYLIVAKATNDIKI